MNKLVLIVCFLATYSKIVHLRTIIAKPGDANDAVYGYSYLMNSLNYTGIPSDDPCLSKLDDKFLNHQPCQVKVANKLDTDQDDHSNVCLSGECVNWRNGKILVRLVKFGRVPHAYYIIIFDNDRVHNTSDNYVTEEVDIDGKFVSTTRLSSIETRLRFEVVERSDKQDHVIFTTEITFSDIIKMNARDVTLPLYAKSEEDPNHPYFLIVNFLI